jgi:hypothetical protein
VKEKQTTNVNHRWISSFPSGLTDAKNNTTIEERQFFEIPRNIVCGEEFAQVGRASCFLIQSTVKTGF